MRWSAKSQGTTETTIPRTTATSSAAVTVWSRSPRRPAPWARATRMLTEVPRHPRVTARMKVRLLEKPTAAIAVAPRPPTTIWLTKFNTSIRTNSMLTGTAMRAISRAGVGGAERRSREMGMAGRGMRVPFDNEVGGARQGYGATAPESKRFDTARQKGLRRPVRSVVHRLDDGHCEAD